MLFCLTTLVASSITKCFGPSWPEVHEAPAAPTAKEKNRCCGSVSCCLFERSGGFEITFKTAAVF